MKKNAILLFLTTLLISGLLSSCATHRTVAYSKSEPICIASELDGSYTLRVEGRGKNASDAYDEAGKQAVYAVLFTSVRWPNGPQKNIEPIFYMKQRAYEMNRDYFNAFFSEDGDYKKYITMKEKRSQTSIYNRTNAQVVCNTTVCVYYSQLRERLIADGIIK